MAGLTHPRGDTFSLIGDRSENGIPVNLTGWTVRSQVRTYTGELIATLAVTLANQVTTPGRFTLLATAAQTALWPTKELLCDVEYTALDASVNSTDVFTITVLPDVTR